MLISSLFITSIDTDHLLVTNGKLNFSDNEKLVAHSRQGSFLQQIDFTVSESGGTVTGSLEKEGGGDLTQFWSDDYDVLDCTGPVCTVDLTPRVGTDTSPAAVFVYILQSDKTTLVANTSFPANSVEHIRVCSLVLQSAATTGTDGALMVRNWNDPAFGITNPRGGDIVSSERVRKEHALHDSGVVLSITGSGTSTVTLDTTAGAVYQFNLQAFPLLDMTQYTIDAVSTGSKTFTISDDGDLSSTFPDARTIQVAGSTGNDGQYTVASTSFSSPDFVITVSEVIPSAVADGAIGDNIHLVNLSGGEYSDSVNLVADITTLADGVTSLGNNKYFNIVIWGVQNRTGEISHLMCNLPIGQYNSSLGGTTDSSKFSVHTIPSAFRGTGFLIAELTFRLTGGGSTWTLVQNKDLLGQTPTLVPGGGITTVVSIFPDGNFEINNSADDTKEGVFDLSGITAGNKRTITWADADVDLADIALNNTHRQDNTQAHSDYLLNSGNDTMAGVLTADGLTLGENENITLGTKTLDHDGTDFVFNDSVRVAGLDTTLAISLEPAASQNYLITVNADNDSVAFEGQDSSLASFLDIYAVDGAGNNVGLQVYGLGSALTHTNSHFLRVAWSQGSMHYELETSFTNTGGTTDLSLKPSKNLLLNPDGLISIGSDWNAIGETCSDLGIVTTVDINGGTINGITDLAVLDGGTGASDLNAFILADGSNALAGAWDMGNQNLTNVDMDTGDIADAVTYDTKGITTYTVAASDAPADVIARADYVCSGSADHVEINAAITAAIAVNGVVELSNGIFDIDDSITIQGSNIWLKGSGKGTKIISTSLALGTENIILVGSDSIAYENIVISDMWLEAGVTIGFYGVFIKSLVDYAEVRNCRITAAFGGVLSQGDNTWIHHNFFFQVGDESIQTSNAENIIIENNIILENGQRAEQAAIRIFRSTNVTVANNQIYDSVVVGIGLQGAQQCVITGNIIKNSNTSSAGSVYDIQIVVNITFGTQHTIISDNVCESSLVTAGIFEGSNANIKHNIISNNMIKDAPISIIHGSIFTEVHGNHTDINVIEYRTGVFKNTSGGSVAKGDVLIAAATGESYDGTQFITTTTQGDDFVLGMALETIADDAVGNVALKGKTASDFKVDGTTDIAIGDFLGTFTTAKIGMKAAAGDMAIAIALEAYTTDDSSGTITVLLITPRKI